MWPSVCVGMELDWMAQVGKLHNKGGVISRNGPKEFKPLNSQNDVGATNG